jgi:hypothetical protein
MLTVKIEEQLKSGQPVEYHYLELCRQGLLQLAKRVVRLETGIRRVVG